MMIVKVTGDPGSGKTTMLSLAAKSSCQEVHSAFTHSKYAVINIILEAIHNENRYVYFDEANDSFIDFVKSEFPDEPITCVVAGEFLG